MHPCPGCHRHVQLTETRCPFCATSLRSVAAPRSLSPLALAAGFCLLACVAPEDEVETNASTGTTGTNNESGTGTGMDTGTDTTTDTSMTETGTTLGDGDGDPNETLESSGADYGGAPTCGDMVSGDLAVGSNPVDTTDSFSQLSTTCGGLQGDGNDELYRFVASIDGPHTVSIVNADFDGWLLGVEDNYYCWVSEDPNCTIPQEALTIDLSVGETLYLWLDGAASGTATIEITEG